MFSASLPYPTRRVMLLLFTPHVLPDKFSSICKSFTRIRYFCKLCKESHTLQNIPMPYRAYTYPTEHQLGNLVPNSHDCRLFVHCVIARWTGHNPTSRDRDEHRTECTRNHSRSNCARPGMGVEPCRTTTSGMNHRVTAGARRAAAVQPRRVDG